MSHWRPQRYVTVGRSQSVDEGILENALYTAELTRSHGYGVPPILTLRHLCHLSGASYPYLRHVIGRKSKIETYRTFSIRKQGKQSKNERRIISVPEPRLLILQKWIAQYILSKSSPHPASKAFAPNCTLVDAVVPHCKARWLIKLDVKKFFESISEIQVYRVFIELGYQPLVAFELSRICTRVRVDSKSNRIAKQQVICKIGMPETYNTDHIGYLPQGAPTSPMLANLVARPLDDTLEKIACDFDLTYTRYADDLTFSTTNSSFNRSDAGRLINLVYLALRKNHLSPNTVKTHIIPPNARKVVLGLFVDRERPRLTRQFRNRLRQHLHYLQHEDFGPQIHADKRGFQSVSGLKNHLYGLVAYAGQVEPVYADDYRLKLDRINW